MKLNRKERRRLSKENKTKVFLADLGDAVRAAKRAELELDDLSKFLRTVHYFAQVTLGRPRRTEK